MPPPMVSPPMGQQHGAANPYMYGAAPPPHLQAGMVPARSTYDYFNRAPAGLPAAAPHLQMPLTQGKAVQCRDQ